MTSPLPPPLSLDTSHWLTKASHLARVLKEVDSADVRLAVLKRLGDRMNEPGYPGLLKLMMILAESEDWTARQRLAETIGTALQRLDLPTGELTAWGSGTGWHDLTIQPGQWLDVQALSASAAPVRRFGPIEYLVVWYCQKTQRPYLSDEAYLKAVSQLIDLFNQSYISRQLYPAKILVDLEHGQEGNYSRRSRASLTRLATRWQAGDTPYQVAASSIES